MIAASRCAGLMLAAWLMLASTLAAAMPRLDLQIELDPVARSLRARADLEPASADYRFVLHESLSVTAASAGGKSLKASPVARDGAARVWRIVLPAGATKLHVEYSGTLPALDRGLDHRGVLRALPPMASPEGSFLPAGGAWYPQPATLFAYRVDLTVPGSQRALVPGRLVEEKLPEAGEQTYRARFEFTQPADGIDLMAGPWTVREKLVPRGSAEALRLRTYFTPELDAQPGLADGYLDDTGRYIALYSEQIGDYPFAGFSIVASPLPTGLGMPTLTYLGADVIRLPFIRATSLGHEVLHNWWGNGVYVDYDKGNWCEGLTTFMADYAYKERESAGLAREMRLGWLRDFAAVPAGDHTPLAAFRSRTHGAAAAVGYGKSAMLFFMLRDAIGEAAFQKGIRAFWENHRFRRAGWDELQRAFEQASGRKLETFFSQWLTRAGGPAPMLKSARMQQQRLVLEVAQAAPAYGLHLPVELVYPDRTETRWIDVSESSAATTLDVPAAPSGVRLDPELRVWRLLEREQLPPILRQWTIASAPRLAIVTVVPEVKDAAAALAQKLFEATPRAMPLDEALSGSTPVLLIGLHGDVERALAQAGLPPPPSTVVGKGSAQVWTIMKEGTPVAVVSAANAEALRALQRPLPHYGAQSWLVFEGGRAIARGVWPAPGKLVSVQGLR